MKHAFCGLIHNFTCMNSNFLFHVSGPLLRPLSNRITVFAGASFHVRFTCGEKKVQLASQPVSQAGRQARPAGQTSQQGSKPASPVSPASQPASQAASQPSQPATQPATQPDNQPSQPSRPPSRDVQKIVYRQYYVQYMCLTCLYCVRSLLRPNNYSAE